MEIDEDVKAFLVESYENLNQIEGDLVTLEQNESDPELMNRIYRALHTIKGNSGFIGLDKLQLVAHGGENLLSWLRDFPSALNPGITSTLLLVVDALRQILQQIESTGEEGDTDYKELLNSLSQLQTTEAKENQGIEEKLDSASQSPHPDNVTGSSVEDSSIRLDVSLLDKLMNLVGELVLSRNQILEFANQQVSNKQADPAFVATSQRLNIVTSELQEGVMKTRLQPIRKIWGKFPRVVRDLSGTLNKQVCLEMEGEDTELDKTLIEAIADPLTHLVRNCVDHGIEKPESRIAKGKPGEGKIFLRAFHESGHVNITIADDGGGIDSLLVKEKAIQRGLISSEKAALMSESQALNLIFLPGLSTAAQITNVSGRGVGMDVVRTNIEKINGTIDVQSRLGKGTTFKLKIPLTLAIIPTLIITSAGDRYAIPQINLLELVRLEGEQAKRCIEMVHGAPVYRLRGRLLPLIYLNRELQLEITQNEQSHVANTPADDSLNIVVLQAAEKPFGLIVDAVNDTQEIVVKPLGKQLKGLSCFAGATIMGDGRVALILDVQGLAQRAHLLSEVQEEALAEEEKRLKQQEEERQLLLLFQGPSQRRMAIPLAHVDRLEEFPRRVLERVGNQYAIQYRGQIMPLIDLSVVLSGDNYLSTPAINLDSPDTNEEDKFQFVVVSIDGEKQIGLVVENILDIVEERIEIIGQAMDKEVQCSAVINQRITEILDVEMVIREHLSVAV